MRDIILGIESSCDDTSAAVIADGLLKSNVIASQKVHEAYGGVVPELASRVHQQNIVPVVSEALRQAGIKATDLSAIAYTRGPGLLGSLHVGTSFAKGMAIGLDIPLIDVNHLHGHVLSHFIKETPEDETPDFPFICLLISGGNSQIVLVKSAFDMEILGQTKEGNPDRFKFSKPHIEGYNYSFSGLKTSFLYTLRDALKDDPDFIKNNKADLCASLQKTIIDILLTKLKPAIRATGVTHVAIGGGVSANSDVREAVEKLCASMGVKAWIPARKFTTDNAAMVAMAGYYKYLKKEYSDLALPPFARITI